MDDLTKYEYYRNQNGAIYQGDTVEVMKSFPANHFTGICTDPPYFLTNSSGSGFMGKEWDSLSIKNVVVGAFFKSMKIDLNMGEDSTAAKNVSMKACGIKNQTLNVLSAENLLEDHQVKENQKTNFVPPLVITKEEALALCKELFPNLTKLVDILPRHALFVEQYLFTKNLQTKNIVRNIVDISFGSPEWLETATSFISTGGDKSKCDRGDNWEYIRKQIYKRDKWACRKCRKHCEKKEIQCHHIEPYKYNQNNSENNLITLCVKCHKVIHEHPEQYPDYIRNLAFQMGA